MSKETRKHPDNRLRGCKALNMDLELEFDVQPTGKLEIPALEPCDAKPKKLMGFNYLMSQKYATDVGIHFFLDDYQFERVWTHPRKYVEKLKAYPCVFTPQFSIYTDMWLPVQIWNTYRSRLIGAYWQSQGINVVPSLQWGDVVTYQWAFDGLPLHSTVAVSALGCNYNNLSRTLWKNGMKEAIRRLEPERILVYGRIPEFSFPGNIEVVRYSSYTDQNRNRMEDR